jgi:hypothetical protein
MLVLRWGMTILSAEMIASGGPARKAAVHPGRLAKVMKRPRFPLRWRHRLIRMMAPRTWQGRALQMVILFVIAVVVTYWNISRI